SQASATGKCLAFGSDRGVDYAITEAGPIYKGVRFTRTVAMLTPQIVLFLDQIEAEAPHTFDLAWHQIGEWIGVPPESGPGLGAREWRAPSTPGYGHISRAVATNISSENLVLKTKVTKDWQPALTLASSEPTEIIKGYGILKTTEDLAPILLQRRHAQSTAFVWAVSLAGEPVKLQVAALKDAAGKPPALTKAALVSVEAGERHWSLVINPERAQLTAGLVNGTVLRTQ